MRAFPIAAGLSAALLLAPLASAIAAERPYVAIEQRLSTEQMQATGLNQLSADQLSLLNRLLSEEQAVVTAQSKAEERDRIMQGGSDPVSSALKGEFRGWTNGMVLELENGQRWRVMDNDFYASKVLAHPSVNVKPGIFGSWYMYIDGVGVPVKVRRVETD